MAALCSWAHSKPFSPGLRPCRIGMVCAFATNQYTHSQTGPSVEAVPETLLSLRGLVSDVPEVSTIQSPHLCVSSRISVSRKSAKQRGCPFLCALGCHLLESP